MCGQCTVSDVDLPGSLSELSNIENAFIETKEGLVNNENTC